MKIAWHIVLIGSLTAAPAVAQPVMHPDGPVERSSSLGVEVLPGSDLDPALVRAAIGAELGIAITDATAFAPSLGRIEIAVDRGEIRIAYHPAAGTVIERTLAMPVNAGERTELIAFVATNLVRDQMSEVIDGLPPIAPPVPPGPPPRASPPMRHIPATLGFVPMVSVDRVFGQHVVVGAGVHVLVGATDGSEYASISGLVDIQHDFASGAQIGGLAASAGRLDNAVQIGGLAAYARRGGNGVQIGGVLATSRGDLHGAQIAGVAATGKRVDGPQIGGVAAIANRIDSVQIGGVTAIAGRVDGVQIAGVTAVGGDVHGVQVSLVNVARRMRGVQVGLVNLSEDGDDAIPIGLINYARNGRLGAEAWIDSSQLSAVGIHHGTRLVHNIWSVGRSPDYDHVLVGAGLGMHVPFAKTGPAIDLDAMHWFTNIWNGEFSQIEQLRASLVVPFGNLEVFGGAAANVYIDGGMDESASFHPIAARRTTTSGGTNVVAWPSAFVGVRVLAR